MKVIFLDFDGVLNSSSYAANLFEAGKPTKDENGHELFDPDTIKRLNCIVDETDAKIVVSSSWRYLGLTALRNLWQERGLHGQIAGMTSIHAVDDYILENGLEWLEKGAINSSPRAVEIETWLHEHDNIDNYVILDDLPMSAALHQHFVQVNPLVGLSDAQAAKAITILIQNDMEKQEIEKLLRSLRGKETSRVVFPSYMDVSKQGDVVILKLQKGGLIGNMQTDAAAFESWALVIRDAFCEKGFPVSIRIDGEKPRGLKESEQKHFNRFLYRLSKFTEIFSWAYTEDFKDELSKFKEQHSNIVINVPMSQADDSAEKGEAIMERWFCEDNNSEFECLDHQLPVRIFDEKISEHTAITASGYIDAWGIKGDTAYVFELKLDNNRKVGAISELMFYVNIIHDLLTHKISIPDNSEYRSFSVLKDYYDSCKCKKIIGRIIAKKYHPLIPITNSVIKEAFDNYPSPISIEIGTDIYNYINDYKLRDMSSYTHNDYPTQQKENQLELLYSGFFGNVEGYGCWWDNKTKSWKNYPQILTPPNSLVNLYAPIRQKALGYFELNDIAWWRQDEDRYFPSGHLLSSQNHCLNHLFALRADKDAVLAIVQAQIPEISEILQSPIDEKFCNMEEYPYETPSYISFEFTYENKTFLNERCNKRGANCTSVDAFVYAKDNEGKHVLIPIEWKYTETYKKTKDKKIEHSLIEKRYLDKIDSVVSHLKGWQDSYYWNPHYELARQSLLMDQIIKNQPFDADYYHHMVVCPEGNTKMLKDALSFKTSLREIGQKRFHVIDPQELLAPLKTNKNYSRLLNYLKKRYWHE